MSTSPKIMVSGHFDPFHDAHLLYLKQAKGMDHSQLICVISSDAQLFAKKRKINITEDRRIEILMTVLSGLDAEYRRRLVNPNVVEVNKWDSTNTLVAEAIRHFKPDIFFRGGDKELATMPLAEWQACQELGVRIIHAVLPYERHGSQMDW